MLIVLALIILSLAIGSVYSWSIFILPIQGLTGFSLPLIQLVFCLTIFTLGTTTSFGSKLINSLSPFKASLIGTLFFASGMILTGVALLYNPVFIYFTYGILVGIGTGIIYLIPVPILLAKFPKHKALGSSISILAFGFGSALFVPVANLFPSIVDAFIIVGIVYGLLMLIASLVLPKIKEQYMSTTEINNSLTREQAIHTKKFWLIFTMIFINIFVGISLISIAAPLAKELLLDVALIVSVVGLCNGFGRIIWAAVADIVGHSRIYIILFAIQMSAIIFSAVTQNVLIITITLFVLASCYGAGFSCLAALVSDTFGQLHAGEIFGTILFAWSLAGFLGPLLMSFLCVYIGSYFTAMLIIANLYFIGLWCSVKLQK